MHEFNGVWKVPIFDSKMVLIPGGTGACLLLVVRPNVESREDGSVPHGYASSRPWCAQSPFNHSRTPSADSVGVLPVGKHNAAV